MLVIPELGKQVGLWNAFLSQPSETGELQVLVRDPITKTKMVVPGNNTNSLPLVPLFMSTPKKNYTNITKSKDSK